MYDSSFELVWKLLNCRLDLIVCLGVLDVEKHTGSKGSRQCLGVRLVPTCARDLRHHRKLANAYDKRELQIHLNFAYKRSTRLTRV